MKGEPNELPCTVQCYVGVPIESLDITVISSSTVFVLWTPQLGNIPLSYEMEVRAVGAPNVPVMQFVSSGTSRSRTVQNLAGGTQYEFTVRPIYEGGIAGVDFTAIERTRDTGMQYVVCGMWYVICGVGF